MVGLDRIRRARKLISPESRIAALWFEADIPVPPQTQGTHQYQYGNPAAGIEEDRIRFEGTFTIEKVLNNSSPVIGHTAEDAVVSTEHGVEDTEVRLRSVLDAAVQVRFDGSVEDKKPAMLFLVAGPPHVRSIADVEIVGPITRADVPEIEEFVRLLLREKYPDISVARAGELLESGNAWLIWLALSRLEELNALRAEHFARALQNLPEAGVRDAILLMIWTSWIDQGASVREGLLDQVFLESREPKRALRILAVVEECLREKFNGARRTISLEEMKAKARAYRSKILDKSAYSPVVQELDRLLALDYLETSEERASRETRKQQQREWDEKALQPPAPRDLQKEKEYAEQKTREWLSANAHLRESPRLDVPVTAEFPFRNPTIEQMLEALRKQTGLRLAVDINLAHTGRLERGSCWNVPASQLMEDLSNELTENESGRWVRTVGGYRLFGEAKPFPPKEPEPPPRPAAVPVLTRRPLSGLALVILGMLVAISLLLFYRRSRRAKTG